MQFLEDSENGPGRPDDGAAGQNDREHMLRVYGGGF